TFATGQLVEPAAWINLPDLAEKLEVPVTRVHQLIRDHSLLAVRRDRVLRVPVELIATPTVRQHLPGVLTLLHVAGYNDAPAPPPARRPAAAPSGDRATAVKRRAQALGF